MLLPDYVRDVETVTIPALRDQLAAFESGWISTGDLTVSNIRRLRENITEYESIVTSLKRGEIP